LINDGIEARGTFAGTGRDGGRTLAMMVAVSTLCHLVVFTGFIFSPRFAPQKKFRPSVINVSMVSLPLQSATVQKGEPSVAKSVTQPVVEKTKKISTAKVSTPKKAPVKKSASVVKKRAKLSLKKKTFKPKKVVKSAINRIEKQVEESRPDPIAQAMDRLRGEVARTDRSSKTTQKNDVPADSGLSGGSGLSRGQTLTLIQIYRADIAVQIRRNWAFSESLAGGSGDLVTELAFVVLPDGSIKDVWFDKRSGNSYLDESARKAVLKSNPVAPHPKGIVKAYISVGLRFTPEGLR
jgi:colicin import membrane protein